MKKIYTIERFSNVIYVADSSHNKELDSVEVSEQTLKDLIAKHPELTQPIEEKKTKFFTAQDGNTRGFILTRSGVDSGYNMGTSGEEEIEKRGVYATKEEAELADQKRMAIVRLWNYADENMYWKPDWSNENQDKYYIRYNHNNNMLIVSINGFIQEQFTLPYFKSKEDAEQFIKDNKADLELLFLK